MIEFAPRLALTVLLTAALLLASGDAAADCEGPFGCVCLGQRTYAGVIQAADNATVQLLIDAVPPDETEVMIGDTLVVSWTGKGQVGERWFVRDAGTASFLVEEVPDNERVACVGSTFTVMEVLSLSAADHCPDEVRTLLDLDDDFGSCNDEPKCECGMARPLRWQGGAWLLLAGLAAAAGRRGRRKPSAEPAPKA